jgi:hypothetical protein
MRVIVRFDPPMAVAKLREWRVQHQETLSAIPDDAIRVDVGRTDGGDFAQMSVEEPYADFARVLTSSEPFECQECHWQGSRSELRRVANEDGSIELLCPSCEQAHWIFPPNRQAS